MLKFYIVSGKSSNRAGRLAVYVDGTAHEAVAAVLLRRGLVAMVSPLTPALSPEGRGSKLML